MNPAKTHKRGPPAALVYTDENMLATLRGLGSIQATQREAAAVLGVSEQTLVLTFKKDERIRDVWEAAREHGKAGLRRAQFRLAESNAAMAIFLGKNILGQRDNQDVHLSGGLEISDARERLAHFLLGGTAAGPREGVPSEIDGSGS